ncbi:uncharacterized protein LOC118429795 isoform X1 [Branchiostoma floridae]|nr:uncharacterized protein LOC118429795 isoform X1 [Branchiostoma floridae]
MYSYKLVQVDVPSHQESWGNETPSREAVDGGSYRLVQVKLQEDPPGMVTSGRDVSSYDLARTDNMQRAYRLNQREQIILDLQVHHLDTQASSSVCGINKEIRMLKGALQQTKRSTGSSADVLESSARERQEAAPEPRRIMLYGSWVGERSLRNRSTLQSELLRNAARMRRRYERGHVEEEEEEGDGEEETKEGEDDKEDVAQDKTDSVEETQKMRKPRTQSLPTRPETPHAPLNDLKLRPSSEPVSSRRRREQNNERRPLLSRPKSKAHKTASSTQSSQDFEEMTSLNLRTQGKMTLNDQKSPTDTKAIGRLSSSKMDLSSIAKESNNLMQTNKGTAPYSTRNTNAKLTTMTSRNRRANKDSLPRQSQAPNRVQNSKYNGYYEPVRPFSADVAHLRHKLEKSRIHFGWTDGQNTTERPSTSSGISPSVDGSHREHVRGAPSDIYSHDSHEDFSDSRPSTQGTWSFVTDATKGGKKSHSSYHSNRAKRSSNLERSFPAKPRKSPRRGRKKSRLKATKVKQPNVYDIWINNFK